MSKMIREGMPETFMEKFMGGNYGGRTGMEAVAGLGVTTGMGKEGVMDTILTFKRYLGTPDEGVIKAVLDLEKAARNSALSVPEYVKGVNQLIKTNAAYNMTAEEATRLMSDFSKQLHEGKISVQDLATVQKGVAGLSLGSYSYLVQQLQSGGLGGYSRLTKMFEGIEPGFAAAAIARGAAYGIPELGGAGTQADLMKATFETSMKMTRDVMSGMDLSRMDPTGIRMIETELMRRNPMIQQMGLSGMTPQVLSHLMSTMGQGADVFAKEVEKTKKEIGPTTLEERIKAGLDAIQDSFGPGKWFELGWKEFWRSAMFELRYSLTYMPGGGGGEERGRLLKTPWAASQIDRAAELTRKMETQGLSKGEIEELGLISPTLASVAPSRQEGLAEATASQSLARGWRSKSSEDIAEQRKYVEAMAHLAKGTALSAYTAGHSEVVFDVGGINVTVGTHWSEEKIKEEFWKQVWEHGGLKRAVGQYVMQGKKQGSPKR